MIEEREMVGAILAGGDSSRMGTDKALLELGRSTLIGYVAEALRSVFQRVVVISNVLIKYSFLNLPTYPDIFRSCGPLGGIHSSLVHTASDRVFVVSCDMPYITQDLLTYVASSTDDADAAVPTSEGRLHPLCAIYARRSLPTITEHLQRQQLRLLDLLQRLRTQYIPITPHLPFYTPQLLTNINTPYDFKASLRNPPRPSRDSPTTDT
jgi:molybdopterin-guanine dinucleotide biosynthesis protein A